LLLNDTCWLQIISQALQSASLSTVCTYSSVDVRAAISAIISSIQKQSVVYVCSTHSHLF